MNITAVSTMPLHSCFLFENFITGNVCDEFPISALVEFFYLGYLFIKDVATSENPSSLAILAKLA